MIARLVIELAKNPENKINTETIIASGIDEKIIPHALYDVVAANDDTPLEQLFKLDEDMIFNPNFVHPETGHTPIVAALKNRDKDGKRRWDQVVAIARNPNHDAEVSNINVAILIAAKENNNILDTLIEFSDVFTAYSNSNGYYPQHWAVANNNTAMLETLLNHGADVNTDTHVTNITPMQIALAKPDPNEETVKCLIEYNAYVDDALTKAAKSDEWEKVKLVLRLDTAHNYINIATQLLLIAVEQNKPDIVTLLLQYGARVCEYFIDENTNAACLAIKSEKWECLDAIISFENQSAIKPYFHQILPALAARNKWDEVKSILDASPSFNAERIQAHTFEHKTTLQWLIIGNQTELFLRLLYQHSVINKAKKERNPLRTAAACKNETALRALIKLGADGEDVISAAATQNCFNEIEFLLAHDKRNYAPFINTLLSDLAASDELAVILPKLIAIPGVSIEGGLHHAINTENWDQFRRLLEADTHYQNCKQLSMALERLIIQNQLPTLQLVLDRGADTRREADRSFKFTLLEYSVKNEFREAALIILRHKDYKPFKDELVTTLHIAVERGDTTLARTIIATGKLKFNDATQILAGNAALLLISEPDMLQKLLDAGLDILTPRDKMPALLELAEKSEHQASVDVLIENGATHQQSILNAAKDSESKMFELIQTHYEKQPNKNETDIDKRLMISRLISLTRHAFDISAWRKLLSMGFVSTPSVEVFASERRWSQLADIIKALKDEPVVDQSILLNTLRVCLEKDAPADLIAALAGSIKDLASYRDPKTGDSFLHICIRKQNIGYTKIFADVGISKSAPNHKKETPFLMLQNLGYETSNGKIAVELSMIVLGTADYIVSKTVESDYEGVSRKIVKDSIERSLSRLKRRYPMVVVSVAVASYERYLNSLGTQPIMIGGKELKIDAAQLKANGRYHLSCDSIRNALAYIWTAACDKTALSVEDLKRSLSENDIEEIVKFRQLAVAERLTEAKRSNKCVNGTHTLLFESLLHAHPDVAIIYNQVCIEAELDEVVANAVADVVPKFFNSMGSNQQRAVVNELHHQNVHPPTFFMDLSKQLKNDFTKQYPRAISGTMIGAMIDAKLSPNTILGLYLNLPTSLIRLLAIMHAIDSIVKQPVPCLPKEEIDHLRALVKNAEREE